MTIPEMFACARANHRVLTNNEMDSLRPVAIMVEFFNDATHEQRAFRAAMFLRHNPTHHTVAFRDEFRPDAWDVFTHDGFDRVRDQQGVQFAY